MTLQQWLEDQLSGDTFSLERLAGDASFRVYYRLKTPERSLIVMDASTERESCARFIAIANELREHQIRTPKILAHSLSLGYILLSDFGDDLYLKVLTSHNADYLYRNALQTLSRIAACQSVSDYPLPFFTATLMRQELGLFQEWFIEKYLRIELLSQEQILLHQAFDQLVKDIAEQPIVFMHRDYHSANLLLLPDNQVGVLDFQDAFRGPVTYDLASLLRDCYVAWPEKQVNEWVLFYRDLVMSTVSDEIFIFWFDTMSMQRHMKALLTFSRKFCRDQNENYLQHIPRTMNYLLQVSKKYKEYQWLHLFFQDTLMRKIVCAP